MIAFLGQIQISGLPSEDDDRYRIETADNGEWVGDRGDRFFTTRVTVTLAATDSLTGFVFAGLLPLVLGLSLSVFGVALAVGAFKPAFVRTVAVWCVLGTVGMLVLVALTLVGMAGAVPTRMMVRSQALLSNFVIGGAVGGTLTGVYAGIQTQQQQAIQEQSNRLVLLNRLLRDEVINAVFAIEGYVDLVKEGTADLEDELIAVFEEKAEHIQTTIDDIKYLTRTADQAGATLEPMAVETHLQRAIETVRESHPDAEYEVTVDLSAETTVWADALLERALANLVDNAVRYSEQATPQVSISTTATSETVAITITDDGPGLPATQQALLEDGQISDHDDPTTGFGLNIVRLLAESYGASIETSVGESGTTVRLELRRVMGSDPSLQTTLTDIQAYGVAPVRLAVAASAALSGGVVMGATMQALDGTIPVIGALYGVSNPLVGWLTHGFHSIVFGMLYPVLLTVVPDRYSETAGSRLGVGLGWGLTLWLVGGGLVMPIWLRMLGIDAPLPNLTGSSLLGHLLWGLVLGVLYESGCRGVGFDSE